jgi:hypothetical protein
VRDKRVNRPLAGVKESFFKERSVERLVSLLGAFHRKMNNVKMNNVFQGGI